MKKRVLSILMAFCLVAALIPAARAEEALVTVTVAGSRNYSQAQEVFRLMNDRRTAGEVPALTHNQTLSDLAMQRAAEISLHYDSSHHRPDGTLCDTIVQGVYLDSPSFGENIAGGQTDAQEVMTAWMDSQGHRENILNATFTQVGVGCFESNGVRTWVQIFGSSTSDTASTDRTGSEAVQVPISTRTEYLDPAPSGEKALELEAGGNYNFRIVNRNTFRDPAYEGEHILNELPLIPAVQNAVDEDGVTIAEISADGAGQITVHAVAAGETDLRFPIYEGQPDPYTIHLTVRGSTGTDPSDPAFRVYHVSLLHSEGGTARLSRDHGREGTVVTLTLAPEEGYYFDQLVVRSAGSYVPKPNRLDEQTFDIPIPDGDLELEVYFADGRICPFVDVKKSDYFYEPVLWAVRSDITSGIDATHFGPGNICTRAQVVTFLWSAAGKPEPVSGTNPFVDVKSSDYFHRAVLWAVENGITSGMDATHFGSDRPCTRAQVVTFLWSAAGTSVQ